MQYDLTQGNITRNLMKFALPLMVGNLLQQLYNVADTLIVGQFLGPDALAAVGSSYTLMVFLTSILLGLCMGSSAFFSMQYGRRDFDRLKQGICLAFGLIGDMMRPLLDWDNPQKAVKNNMNVMIAMMVGWVYMLLVVGISAATGFFIAPVFGYSFFAVVSIVISVLLLMVVKKHLEERMQMMDVE